MNEPQNTTKKPDSRRCPMCHEAAGWRNPPEFDSATLVFDGSKKRLRVYPFVCENCGFVRLHETSKIVFG